MFEEKVIGGAELLYCGLFYLKFEYQLLFHLKLCIKFALNIILNVGLVNRFRFEIAQITGL